jgi:hypothetical protein
LVIPDRHIRGNVAFIFASLDDPRGLQTTRRYPRRPVGAIRGSRNLERARDEPISVRAAGRREIRYYARTLLGDLRDPRGLCCLRVRSSTNSRDTIHRAVVARTNRGQARSPTSESRRSNNDDPSMRLLAICAARALHAKEAIPRLLTLVNDDRQSVSGRSSPCQRQRRRLSRSCGDRQLATSWFELGRNARL